MRIQEMLRVPILRLTAAGLSIMIVGTVGITIAAASNRADAGVWQMPSFQTLAQGSVPKSRVGSQADRKIVYKAAGVVISTLVISFLSWFVAYPTFLRQGTVWPVTLYGRCTAFAWCASWLVALWIFWDVLKIRPEISLWEKKGLRFTFVFVALFFSGVSLLIWRSEKKA
ncbi:MAG TPA: hypothetical protein PLR25_11125 [Planctomycetaceae bacterium]|nr:hypothetical protein [Planctomycetaceae bacterium]